MSRVSQEVRTCAADTALGAFTDEELASVGARHDSSGWFGGLAPDQRRIAMRAGLRALTAAGHVAPSTGTAEGQSPQHVEVVGGLARIMEMQRAADRLVRVDRRLDGRSAQMVVHLPAQGAALEDVLGSDGLHHFTVRCARRQAAALIGFADPCQWAREDGPARTVTEDRALRELARRVRSGALFAHVYAVALAEPRCDELAIGFTGGPDGLRAVTEHASGCTVREVGQGGLAAMVCTAMTMEVAQWAAQGKRYSSPVPSSPSCSCHDATGPSTRSR